MNVLLINPPKYNDKNYIREGRCMQPTSSWGSFWMPLSIAYTAALLRKNGHKVKIIDCQAENHNKFYLINIVELFQPTLIIINTGFPSIKGDIHTISFLKQSLPNVSTVAIGMYPTLIREKMLEKFIDIDYAVIGEPEWVVTNLARSIESKKKLRTVNGLIYRNGSSEIIFNDPQNFIENDINELPFPARDLLDNGAYRQVYSNKRFTHINIARGCPYKCTFCNAPAYYGNGFRKRNIESIILEIKECIDKFAIKTFIFWAEECTLDILFMSQLAEAIIENGISITWYARARVDNVNIDLLRKMKHAGCKGIGLGIESISDEIHDKTHKGITYNQIVEAINIAKKAEIKTTGHFVFGLPGDTETSAIESIRFARKSGLDLAQFYCAVPYPGTKYGDLAKENGWIESFDYSRYHLAESITKNESLSTEKIMKLRKKAYRLFYLRPRYLWNAIVIACKHKSLYPLFNFFRWVY